MTAPFTRPRPDVDVVDHRRRRERHGGRARRDPARAQGGALRAQRSRLRRERQLERHDPRRAALPHVRPARHRDVVPRLGPHPGDRAAPALPHPVPDAHRARREGPSHARPRRRVLRRVRPLPAAEARQAARAPHARTSSARARAGPRRRSWPGGVTFDEWGIDGARLCVANAVDASERGARVYTHTTVERSLVRRKDTGAVMRRALARAATAATAGVTTARAVVNATGAWAPHHRRARRAREHDARACGRARASTSSSTGASPTTPSPPTPSTAGRSSSSPGRT